jgi:RHS repeat-associated protein
MLVPNRHSSTDAYRYGFQGQEKDDEIKGEGNSLNYTFRMHDPRAGRFFATDPLTSKYPFYSPYSFSGNRVIDATELEGLEPVITITKKPTGFTVVKVYGYLDSSKAIIVKTYEATIHYKNPDGTQTYLGSFNVTRDGWTAMGTDANDKVILVNRSTEPDGNSKNISSEVGLEYGEKYGKGTPAMQLPDIFVEPIPGSSNVVYDKGRNIGAVTTSDADFVRKKSNVATSVQIHVGGVYEKIDGDISLGGTYGCFGVVAPEQVYKTEAEAKAKSDIAVKANDKPNNLNKVNVPSTSNSEMKKFSDTANKLRKKGEKIEIKIEKREFSKKGTVSK